ncbi:hypothetical protein Ndes2526A_g09108 [Nannochloris sp. 'desiccata']
MKLSKVVFVAAVLLFACSGATAARTMLQQPEQPPQEPEQPPQQPEQPPQQPEQPPQEPEQPPQQPEQPPQEPEQPPQEPEQPPQEPEQPPQEPEQPPQEPQPQEQEEQQQQEPQAGAPQQCEGEWSPQNIDCTFRCSTGAWEFECEAIEAEFNFASCRVKREDGADEETIYFYCLIPNPGSPPDCQQGLTALNSNPDQCVIDNATEVLGLWPASAF